MKKIIFLLRNLLFSGFVLYGYNLIAVNFNMFIPINFITLMFITVFGIPSLIALLLFKILVL